MLLVTKLVIGSTGGAIAILTYIYYPADLVLMLILDPTLIRHDFIFE